MYFFSGVAKLNEFWFDGLALEYALHLEMYCKPFGAWLRGLGPLLIVVTYATLLAELIAPILVFMPRINQFARGIFMASFMLLHLGILLTMSIGIFSLTAIASWVIFVPTQVWDREYPDRSSAVAPTPTSTGSGPLAQFICALLLIYVVALNILNVAPRSDSGFESNFRKIGHSLMVVQEFKMFGIPPTISPWVEHRGQTKAGNWVDLITADSVQPGVEPKSIYSYSRNQHWRRIYWNLLAMPGTPEAQIRQRILEKMVNRWNQTGSHDAEVVRAEFVAYSKQIQLGDKWSNPESQVYQSWQLGRLDYSR